MVFKRKNKAGLTPLVLVALAVLLASTWSHAIAKDAASIQTQATAPQPKKLHPEISDPVLGDRAALVEWAWSPQYAKRFGVAAQADGLKDGYLWLVGIKIVRVQSGAKDFQSYQCRLAGLIDNKAPMLMPPGERYVMHPGHHWLGGMPGKVQPNTPDMPFEVKAMGLKEFSPAQTTWYKHPHNKLEKERPERSITTSYLLFQRQYTPDLAYFELETSCSYFGDPATLRSEVRFPTETFPPGENGQTIGKTYASSALKFDLPDGLMRKTYPHIVDAADWGSCLERRATQRRKEGFLLTTHAFQSRRFGKACEQGNPASASNNQ